MGIHQKLSTFLFKKAAYKTSAQLAELYAVIEFNPIGSFNPTKSGGGSLSNQQVRHGRRRGAAVL